MFGSEGVLDDDCGDVIVDSMIDTVVVDGETRGRWQLLAIVRPFEHFLQIHVEMRVTENIF